MNDAGGGGGGGRVAELTTTTDTLAASWLAGCLTFAGRPPSRSRDDRGGKSGRCRASGDSAAPLLLVPMALVLLPSARQSGSREQSPITLFGGTILVRTRSTTSAPASLSIISTLLVGSNQARPVS